MANFPQKRKVNVAASGKRTHDLSHAHITTIDFGRMKSIENRYMVPGDVFKCNIRSVTQVLSALPSPTFGSFNVNFRAYFVPINTIWAPFYDFIKNQQSVIYGNLETIQNVPFAYLSTFINMFLGSSYSTEVSNPSSPSEYDFKNGTKYYALTRLGRICLDFLHSNRCNIDFAGRGDEKINVLPLVAFWKTYFDWVVPSRFIHDHEDYIERVISAMSNLAEYEFTQNDLELYLVKEPLCYYMDDVFTTATENAFSNADSSDGTIVIDNPSNRFGDASQIDVFRLGSASHVPSSSSSYVSDGAVVTPTNNNDLPATGNGLYSFNMYTLQTLGKLQDLLNRNLIAGTKVQDWLLTEFGMRPSTDALHLSKYLGVRENSMAISDILSTADTASQGGVALGSYGGRLKERFDFDFEFKAEEHGYFIITYELVPRTSYFQGKEPEYDMLNSFDFFQPEFDNQQGAPILFKDLYFDGRGLNGHKGGNDFYGFTLQYSRLKFANDVISGDFRNRFGLALKSWFLARDMDKITRTNGGIDFIDEEFCLVRSKYQDWNYIFADTNDELDHFVSIFYFHMPCERPMKSITEGYEPTYKNSGKEVNVNFSGSVQ